jgi:YidC/Oxa1 family membrane protein insertase
MELSRIFLASALFLVAFMLWKAWENDYPPPIIAQKTVVATSLPPQAPINITQPVATPTAPISAKTPAHRLISVKTDVLNVTIDTQGGNIVRADLLKYPEKLSNGKKSDPFQLLNDNPATLYVAQSGLLSTKGPDTSQGQAVYSTPQSHYELAPDQKELTVNLEWKNKEGLIIHKNYIFTRGDYQIRENYQIVNHTTSPWIGQLYSQLQRKKPTQTSAGLFGINPYMGAAISSPQEHYQKIPFPTMEKQNLNQSIQGGWAAMLQHYFLSAWVPDPNQTFNYYTQVVNGDTYTVGMIGPPVTANPGAEVTVGTKLYVGPAIISNLKKVAPNLDLTVDYGILWFISIAIFWLLKHVYQIVGNWGWAIVIVTILIKLAFYHLSAKSYHSMANMRKLQPRLQAIKERYADDKQKMTQATMELYKTEKVNPLGGCLPIIVQIPVFIALYWVLLESVELRQAPFIFWIHDLSAKDPFYVLPILMGISMFVQQKLNPPPPDPTMAKMMQFLPVFFIFLFMNFPAGLVLYWLVNNTLSILQQWYVMRKVESATPNGKMKKTS